MSLADYFSDEALIAALCRIRIKEADKAEKVANGFHAQPGQQFEYITAHFLPPRRLWNRYRPRERSKLGSTKVSEKSLKRATIQLRAGNAPWVSELNCLLLRVRQKALVSENFAFTTPHLSPVLKKGNVYRPLASFDLEDKLIDGALAKYWKDQLDELFDPASMAFRARPTDGSPMPSAHMALDLICERRDRSPSGSLYAAECDIKGFFDCVDHDVARTQLRRLLEVKQSMNPAFVVEPRAILLFEAFLDCYSFREHVLGNLLPRLRRWKPKAEINWPEPDLRKLHEDFDHARIGVPQGGALSGIIANIVLDLADKRVRELASSAQSSISYLRYCDDMIILAQSRKQCSSVFQAYLATLSQLRLPYHEPVAIKFYDRAFWEFKSRLPYRWTGKKWFNCVPWIQFVGYQIRYDGLVRIRKESEAKHIGRVIEKTGWFINAFLPGEARNRVVAPIAPDTPYPQRTVVAGLYGRLSSMAVGRANSHQDVEGPRQMCWAAGFKGLHGKPFVDGVLRRLDRIRGKQISRFIHKPIRFGGQQSEFRLSAREANEDSYHAQFSNNGGDELIKNPYQPSWIEQKFFERLYLWRLAIHLKKKTAVGNTQHLPPETPAAHQ